MKYIRNLTLFALSMLIFAACTESSGDGSLTTVSSTELPAGLGFLASQKAFEPQVTILSDDSLVLTWREKSEAGSNIFASVREADGHFGDPVRINDVDDTVESYTHDGMRISIAVGAGNTIAIAWPDGRAQVRAAISNDGGKSFQPSIQLDQSDGPAYRAYPTISFDPTGTLHAIWIDSRFAENFAEEPADLFYASVKDGVVTEKNLTAEQEPSICGCCRTFIRADSESVRMTFRNTSADGFRDPNTISGTLDGEFSQPRAVSEPLWELRGCPMAGPVQANGDVLWHDGSTGKKLLMIADPDSQTATGVFNDEQRNNWIGRRPPRAISTARNQTPVLLLPGEPNSRLIAQVEREWTTIEETLPIWSTSGAYDGSVLYLVGAPGGEFHIAQYKLADETRRRFDL